MTATIPDWRYRWFLRKCCRATRRDRARVLRPVPRRHSPAVWIGSYAIAFVLFFGLWVLAGGVAWMVLR